MVTGKDICGKGSLECRDESRNLEWVKLGPALRWGNKAEKEIRS